MHPVKMTSIDSVFGKLSFPAPPLVFSNLVLSNDASLMPYGADEAAMAGFDEEHFSSVAVITLDPIFINSIIRLN